MSETQLISTSDYALSERGDVWRDLMMNQFSGLNCDIYGNQKFFGHLDIRHAGDVTMINLEADPHKVIRTDKFARTSPTDYLKMIVPIKGQANVSQYGRDTSVQPGSWVIYDTSNSYEISNYEKANYLIIMLPRYRLVTGKLAREFMANSINASKGVSRLALSTIGKAWQELPYMDQNSSYGSGEIITQLIHLALTEFSGNKSILSTETLLKQHAKDTISQYIRNPKLNVEMLAELLGCSTRSLYSAFQNSDKTINQIIQEQRLTGCIHDFQAPHLSHLSITEIALSWGFNNPSYFSKLFRDFTGLQPRAFRNRLANN